MHRRSKRGIVISAALLAALAVFFCWFEVGRFGIFGSMVDWISQHSVLPDYFRQQFYETGKLIPEFAPGLGGGQNAFNFAYYGILNPLILPSYLMPGVKMGDYLMAVSVLALAAGGVIFYLWLLHRGFSGKICFGTALMYLLAGPMIFQSARHVMFVDYMPFLCMGLWGVDRYFDSPAVPKEAGRLRWLLHGRCGLYVLSVFLMIMTSFYYSIGGMLALTLYGIYRYASLKEADTQRNSRKGIRGVLAAAGDFLLEGIRFALPMLCAVMMSAVLLLPTLAALTGNRSGSSSVDLASLFVPDFSVMRLLYGSYEIGLTSLAITVMIAGLAWKKNSERFLAAGCLLILILPFFSWALNGGLYVREKVLIPFLPLYCYLIACYCSKKHSWAGVVPYLLTVFLIYTDCAKSLMGSTDSAVLFGSLPQRLYETALTILPYLEEGKMIGTSQRWVLILLDAVCMLLWFVLFVPKYSMAECRGQQRDAGKRGREGGSVFVLTARPSSLPCSLTPCADGISLQAQPAAEGKSSCDREGLRFQAQQLRPAFGNGHGYTMGKAPATEKRTGAGTVKRGWLLLILPLCFLALFGASFHGTGNFESEEFYDAVTNPQIGEVIREVLSEDPGLYRTEQYAGYSKNGANVDRVWSAGQYLTSVYSSCSSALYRSFCTDTFGVEEPTRTYGDLEASANPLFRKLMGVRYLVTEQEKPSLELQGYELIRSEDGICVYRSDSVAPMAYVTDQTLSQKLYESLDFPYNQTVLMSDAVVEDDSAQAAAGLSTDGSASAATPKVLEALKNGVAKMNLTFEASEDTALPEKTEDGYLIQTDQTLKLKASLSAAEEDAAEDEARYLYVQFTVKNLKHTSDVTVQVGGVQNRLSAITSTYYNENEVFTYAIPLETGQTEVNFSFGKGKYEISDIQCYTQPVEAVENASSRLWQSAFDADDKTGGNRISGTVTAETDGYFITSVPYDENFEVTVDGEQVEAECVNTAFLGFPVEAGEHEIVILYHAPKLAEGKAVSGAGVLLFAAALILRRKNRKTLPF